VTYYIYMLSNRSRVVLYVGVTNSLEGRLWHHTNTVTNSFVKKYKLDRLVYYELYHDIRGNRARKTAKTLESEKEK
jgi:putative endonuclease